MILFFIQILCSAIRNHFWTCNLKEMNTLLYLEDDDDDRFLFDKAVNEIVSSSSIVYANSEFDVLQILQKEEIDVIFLDIFLPAENGMDCLKRIRASSVWNHVPIIMYSAHLHTEWIEHCTREKANLYVQKPKDYNQIVTTLRKVLEYDWRVLNKFAVIPIS